MEGLKGEVRPFFQADCVEDFDEEDVSESEEEECRGRRWLKRASGNF
jgi:hypothetical protein